MKKLSVLLILILISGLLFGQDGFGDIFDSEELDESQKNVVLNGDIGFGYRSYLDDAWDSEKIFLPFTNLNLLFSTDSLPVEAKIGLTIEGNDLNTIITVGDIISELSLRSFF